MGRLQTPLVPLIGRVLLGIFFLLAGLAKLGAASATIGYIGSAGLPVPPLAYAVTLIVEIGGGALLIAGFATRWAALVAAVWCLVTALIFHTGGDMANQIHLMKNIALTGGYLYVAAFGAGAWSIDAMLAKNGRLTLLTA